MLPRHGPRGILQGMKFFPTSTRFRVRRGAVIAVLLAIWFAGKGIRGLRG